MKHWLAFSRETWQSTFLASLTPSPRYQHALAAQREEIAVISPPLSTLRFHICTKYNTMKLCIGGQQTVLLKDWLVYPHFGVECAKFDGPGLRRCHDGPLYQCRSPTKPNPNQNRTDGSSPGKCRRWRFVIETPDTILQSPGPISQRLA